MEEHQQRLRRVRVLIGQEPDLPDVGDLPGAGFRGRGEGNLGRLCRAATRALPASGVGLSVLADGVQQGVAAACSPVSAAVEDLQFMLGEGPCVDAVSTARPVLAADLQAMSSRWPAYAPAAQQHGVRAVFAFPLQVGALCLGAMDVYAEQVGPMDRWALGEAMAFADVAMLHLLHAQEQAPRGELAVDLEEGFSARAELYQAQGMLAARLDIGLGEAMTRLRAYAYAHERRLIDVARDVLEHGHDLDTDPPSPEPGSGEPNSSNGT